MVSELSRAWNPILFPNTIKLLKYSATTIDNSFDNNINPTTQPIAIKLDDHNYLLWKQQISIVVEGLGLEGFKFGSIMCPPEFVSITSSNNP